MQRGVTTLVPLGLHERIAALESSLAEVRAEKRRQSNSLSIVAFSGDLDRLLAAMNVATGSAAMGMDVHVFFAFWAVGALRSERKARRGLLGFLTSRGPGGAALSRYHLGGLGAFFLARRMKKLGQPGLPELIAMARESGVRFSVCEASMGMLGIALEDLEHYPGLSACGVTSFMESASQSQTTLFI